MVVSASMWTREQGGGFVSKVSGGGFIFFDSFGHLSAVNSYNSYTCPPPPPPPPRRPARFCIGRVWTCRSPRFPLRQLLLMLLLLSINDMAGESGPR